MRKLILPVLLLCTQVHAQLPTLSGHTKESISRVTFWYENCFLNQTCHDRKDKKNTEVPPWIIPGGWRSYFFNNGYQSHIWSTPKSLVDNSLIDLKNDAIGPFLASTPYSNDHWRRNYHTIFSAHLIAHPTYGNISLGFCHSENKNSAGTTCGDGDDLQNTIQPNITINCSDHSTYTGGNPATEGWNAYNALITAVWTPNNEQTNWGQQYFSDLGPVAWPSTGYTTVNGIKCTSGLKHPSSIVFNNYVYIFFSDGGVFGNNIPKEEGREGGIKIVRVHKDQALDPNNYKIYYKDPNVTYPTGDPKAIDQYWIRSLPEGFTKENMLNYVSVKGPKSTDIFGDNFTNSAPIRFSVAKVRNTNYFIGIEEYHDFNDKFFDGTNWISKSKVAIRFSEDLINWGPREVIYVGNTFEESQLTYPIFLSKDGWSNTEVDLDDFYVIGSEDGPRDYVNKMRIYKYIPPPPPPPPTGECPPDVMCEVRTKKAIVPEENLSFAVSVMPNPVSGNMAVEVSVETLTKASINLYNAEGRFIKRLSEEALTGKTVKSFDLSQFASGIYYLEVLTDKQRLFKKVLKY